MEGALLLPKSLMASQSSTGAVELRPYKPTYKVSAPQLPICNFPFPEPSGHRGIFNSGLCS